MTNWTDEDELRLSIAMALSKIKTKPRGAERDAIYRRMVAEQIVAHLNYRTGNLSKGRRCRSTASPARRKVDGASASVGALFSAKRIGYFCCRGIGGGKVVE